MRALQITSQADGTRAQFRAMASPCEILIDTNDMSKASSLATLASEEVWRIEQRFSRYRDDNIVHAINSASGTSVQVDDETAALLDFADQCFQLSDGMFDITSGILRRVWRFDGGHVVPEPHALQQCLSMIGWQRVSWQRPFIRMPAGMELDFGGIGKEYAVDKVIALMRQSSELPVLVNLGGDLHASAPPRKRDSWAVGIEGHPSVIGLHRGALATSGNAYRYILHEGVRYGHVLNPVSGWPAPDAPQAVTVAANSCSEAGVLSTLAMLKGRGAEEFLTAAGARFWCQR